MDERAVSFASIETTSSNELTSGEKVGVIKQDVRFPE